MSKGTISQNDELRIRFTAWITVLVKRAKIDYIRQQCRQPKSVPWEQIPEDEVCTEHEFNTVIESAESFEFDDENVAKAYSALSLFRQKILKLMFVQGKTAEQVAAILGRSTKHISMQSKSTNESSIYLYNIGIKAHHNKNLIINREQRKQ